MCLAVGLCLVLFLHRREERKLPLVIVVVLTGLALFAMVHKLNPDNNAFWQIVVG